MEDYLNDSPADFANPQSSANTSSTTGTPKYNYAPQGNQQEQSNNFSLNLGYSDQNFGNSNLNNNANYTSPQQYNGNYNSNYLNDPTVSSSNSFTNDPFLDDLDNLNFPQMNQPSIDQAFDMNPQMQNQSGLVLQTLLLQIAPQDFQNQQYSFNEMDNGLNEIASPNNGASGNMGFLNPRYFSPTNRGSNFNSLNAIAEDDLGLDNFSPQMNNQEYGSSFKSIPDVQSGMYFSPQNNNKYLSPGNYDSVDTLRSPSQSYLNSPPQYLNTGMPAANLSTSIPNYPHMQQAPKKEQGSNLLSPPNTSSMSASVPTSTILRDSVPTKLLTKEEKLKRRREFHNAVERRRRDLIKERIKELGTIVPPSLLNPQLLAVQMLQKNNNSSEFEDLISNVKVKETKPNKSTILNKSVDYIKHLMYVLEQQELARTVLIKKIQDLQNGESYNPPPAPTTATNYERFSDLEAPTNSNQTSDYFNPDEFFLDIMKSDAGGNKLGDYYR